MDPMADSVGFSLTVTPGDQEVCFQSVDYFTSPVRYNNK